MLSRTYSATLQGLQATAIEVEADSVQGKPNFILIGLPEKTLDEARERLSSALQCCGVRLKCKRTIVNLAPADLKKNGSTLELAIAVALLELTLEKKLTLGSDIFFGELALNGEIRAIHGALSLVNFAKKHGFKRVFLPKINAGEVSLFTDIEIYPLAHLQELIDFLRGKRELEPLSPQTYEAEREKSATDFADIIGQKVAKRCLEIAAAGGHNLLLCGVPGAGKSLLASALPSILPPLTQEEALILTEIYSVAGLTNKLITTRPCRSPHHSISAVGLAGGGTKLLPGEISLAHHGILFLDELAEFRRDALEVLRQPLETGQIIISRAAGCVTYPAQITLIAASNPCPCGYLGSHKRHCRCTPADLARYRRKLSGPIIDRLDMQIFVAEVNLETLVDKNLPEEESSALIRQRVMKAREKAAARWAACGLDVKTNSQLTSAQIRQFISLTPAAVSLLQAATLKWQLSARAYFKLIKVARTIADLEPQPLEVLDVPQVAESLSYRQG